MPIIERDETTGRAKTDDPKDNMMRLTESEHSSIRRMRNSPKEHIRINTNTCYNCNRSIRTVTNDEKQTHFFCNLLVCKLIALTMMGKNWMLYVDIKDHEEARGIIDRMSDHE